MPRIGESTFTIVANGRADSPAPPAPQLRDYLIARGARRVTTVFHPLSPEDGREHTITHYRPGARPRRRRVALPSRPPATYPLDLLVPPAHDAADLWVGLNNLAAARGLVQRARGRAGKVVYWAIDFVPDRFGPGLATRAYDAFDRWCCSSVDARYEVSAPALEARSRRLGLDPATSAPARVMPMGAWLDTVTTAPEDGWRSRKIVYLGHLVERQGVGRLLDALAVLAGRGTEFSAEIAGRGPLLEPLKAQVAALGLEDRVRLLGPIGSHEGEAFVASGAVAVAPYDTAASSFSRYADPSKIRSYMAGGLPVVLTPVPPQADEFVREGGAIVVDFEAAALADAIERALDPVEWPRRRASALAYMRRFDWNRLFGDALGDLGFE